MKRGQKVIAVMIGLAIFLSSSILFAKTKMLCTTPISKIQVPGMIFSGKSHVYNTDNAEMIVIECGTLCEATGDSIRTNQGVAYEVILLSGKYNGRACYVFPEWINDRCSCSK
jgi:hypothetical protein